MSTMNGENNQKQKPDFIKKVWITGGIFALIAALLLLINAAFNIFLLVIAATLIAVYFRGLSGLIEEKSGWKRGLALALSILGTLLIGALIFWLIGAKIQSQTAQLLDNFPSLIQNAKAQLNQNPIGRRITEYFTSGTSISGLKSMASSFLKSTFGILGDLYVILIAGIYLTASPHLYKKGIVQLVPSKGQKKAGDTLTKLGHSLKQWLKGKLLSMLIIFVLIAIGLKIIGLPMWLALAFITALLNFIPNFGPIIAAIPAILLGLTIDPTTAWMVAGLYLVAQTAEGSLITPQIQKKMVHIPPALLIVSQAIITSLTGFWGLILAAPLLVVVTVLVRELYVRKNN